MALSWMSFPRPSQSEGSTSGTWDDFLSDDEIKEAFVTLNDDSQMPWNLNPSLGGVKLRQHAYTFNRSRKDIEAHKGLALIDSLCDKITQRFDCEIADVFCNRF